MKVPALLELMQLLHLIAEKNQNQKAEGGNPKENRLTKKKLV